MNPEDVVNLIVLTHHNHFHLGGLTRLDAMALVKEWHGVRDKARKGDEPAGEFLAKGTITGGFGGLPDHWAIAMEHVVGMYIYEITETAQEIAAKAARKMANLMEGEAEERERGEEWRQGGEE